MLPLPTVSATSLVRIGDICCPLPMFPVWHFTVNYKIKTNIGIKFVKKFVNSVSPKVYCDKTLVQLLYCIVLDVTPLFAQGGVAQSSLQVSDLCK